MQSEKKSSVVLGKVELGFVFLYPAIVYFLCAGGLRPLISGDIATQFMIYLGRLRKAFLSGQFPFWEPLWAGGFPFAADPQTMCYYPPAWIAAIVFPPAWAATFLLLFHLGLGALGMWLVARHLTGSKWGAWLASIMYSLGGFPAGHIMHLTILHVLGLFPWLLLLILPSRPNPFSLWRVFGAAIIFALIFLAGHPQSALIVSAAVGLFVVLTAERRVILRGFCAFLLGVCFAAIALSSYYELARESVRADFSYGAFTLGALMPLQLLMFLSAFFFGVCGKGFISNSTYWGGFLHRENLAYVGLLPLILALTAGIIGITRRTPWRRQALASVALVIIGLIFACSKAFGTAPLLYHLPIVGKLRVHARYLLFTYIGLCLLAPMGLVGLMGKWHGISRKEVRRICVIVLIFILVVLYVFELWGGCFPESFARVIKTPNALAGLNDWWDGTNQALKYASLLFMLIAIILWKKRRAGEIASLVILLTIVDLGAMWYDLFPRIKGVPPALPRTIEAALSRPGWTLIEFPYLLPPELKRISPNHPLTYGLKLLNQYNPLMLRSFGRCLSIDSLGRVNNPLTVFGDRYVCSAFGIRHAILCSRSRKTPDGRILYTRRHKTGAIAYPLPDTIGHFHKRFIYMNLWFGEDETTAPLSLAYIPAQIMSVPPDDFYGPSLTINTPAVEELSTVQRTRAELPHPNPPGRIIEERCGSCFAEAQIDAEKDALIVFRLIAYPGWRLKIDGKPAPILKANCCFLATRAQKGRHLYRWHFRPTFFIPGALLSGISLFLALVLAVFYGRRRRKT